VEEILQTPLPDANAIRRGKSDMRMRRKITIAGVAFVLGLFAALVYLREPTVPLTEEAWTQARQRWREAGIRAYHLTYRMHGSLYEVEITNGLVADITVNGQTLSIAQPGAYSVDGLFEMLAMELENLSDASKPLGNSMTNVIARVRFHARYGYPERYVRGGGAVNATLQVIRFTPR